MDTNRIKQLIFNGESLSAKANGIVDRVLSWCGGNINAFVSNGGYDTRNLDVVVCRLKEHLPAVSGMSFEEIFARSRKRQYIYWREICLAIMRYGTTATLCEIGSVVGLHYTTIVNALQVCGDDYRLDKQFRRDYDKLNKIIQDECKKL